MERPQYEPAYPQPIRVFQKIDIAEHEPFYRLICSTGYRFERFERQRIFVVLCVPTCIEPFQRKDEHENARERNRNHLCHNRRFISDHRPIADEIFLVYKQVEELYCRNLERLKVEGSKISHSITSDQAFTAGAVLCAIPNISQK